MRPASTDDAARRSIAAPAFLAGGGEMGVLMRAHDWAASPLGLPKTWPQPLRTAIRLLLNAGHPMYIWWGPGLLCFYNDAYRSSIGPERHPGSLGRPGREVWDEIWPIIGPQVEQVMAGGGATWHENALVPITRNGRREDVWWTYSYGPLDDEAAPSGVGGVLVICAETTEHVLTAERARGERERQAFLLKLSDALRPLADPVAIQGEATRLLREHLGAGWCYYVEWDEAGTVGSVLRDSTREGLPSMVGVHDVSDAPEFTGLLRSGRLLNVPSFADFPLFGPRVVERYTSIGIRSVLGPSLVKDGRLVATLSLADTVPRDWSGEDVALLEEVAERTWAAVERARAEAALRAGEERLRLVGRATNDAVMDWDLRTDRIVWNEAIRTVFGHDEGARAVPAGWWRDRIHPEDRDGVLGGLDAARAGDAEQWAGEYRFARADGSFARVMDRGFILRDQGRAVRIVGSLLDVTDVRRAEAALHESEARLREFGEASSDVLWTRDAATLQWEYLSPAFEAIYGMRVEEALAGDTMRNWTDLIVEEDRSHAVACIDRVRAGERVTFEYRVRRPADGAVRLLRNTDFPIRDASGRVARVGGVGHDATAEQAAAERLKVLVAELQHRTRNLIGVVRSVANQTMAATGPGEAFRAEFGHRLEALARVQGLLSRSDEEPVTIEALIRMELDALGFRDGAGGRVVLDGPRVGLRHSIVQTLALALHELATNARKHGTLATDGGRLSVTWRVRQADGEGRRLALEWLEAGAEAPADATAGAAPDRRGYGRELIERALPYALGATTAYERRAGGARCTIDLPLEKAERRRRA